MEQIKSRDYIFNQLTTLVLVALSFFAVSRFTSKTESFAIGMLIYWTILTFQLLLLDKETAVRQKLADALEKTKNVWLSLVCFVPSVLVFSVAFFPLVSSINISILLLTIVIGVINGFLEELYWRGKIYRSRGILLAVISTILFAANHGAFLFFDLIYQGGAMNLIGGPLIMGAIWITVAKATGTIKYGIVAHQIVNALAFYSLIASNI